MSDLFISQSISPMLLRESKPFNNKDYIFEIKLDGFRCIAYLDENFTLLKSRNNKDITQKFPELLNLHRCVKKRCVLDGEIVCLKDGKPNFSILQQRNLIGSQSKITAAAAKNPAQFVAFDILYLNRNALTSTPLIKRKSLLTKTVKEGFNLSISRYVEEFGEQFFNLAKEQNLEGIVAKRKDGLYYFGKRTYEWLKIKAICEDDFYVCGFIPDDGGNAKHAILGSVLKSGELCCRGKVCVYCKSEQIIIKNFAKNYAITTPWFKGFKNAVWLKLQMIGTVRYLQITPSGSLRHPVWKELKDNHKPL